MLDVPLGFRDYAKADRQFYAGVDCTQRTAFARIVDGTCKPIQSNLCTGPLNPYVFDLDDVVDTIHGAVKNGFYPLVVGQPDKNSSPLR